MQFELSELAAIKPELFLFATAIAALISDIRFQKTRPYLVVGVVLLGMAAALATTLVQFSPEANQVFSRSLLIDPVSQFFKALLILTGMLCVCLGWISREIRKGEKSELQVLIVLGTLAMCIMCSAVHFLLLFIAYEAASMASTILIAFKRKSQASSEAAIKLYLHSALTSVFFVVGIVMLYGLTHTFNILDIRASLANITNAAPYLWVAFGLIFTAVAAKMMVFPFHSLSPDVVEGAPTPVSAFFSISSTIAASAFALRLCIHVFSVKGEGAWAPLTGFDWPQVIAGVAAVTMTVGNLTAIHQTNLKRLIGYSGIAHAGYILMGVAVLNLGGLAAVLFSLVVYVIMALGAFFVIQMVTDQAKSEETSILKGLVWRNPFEGVALCIFLLGLAGLPPLVGFVGRFYILGVAVNEKLYWLAIVAAINWVIGLSYYLLLIRNICAPRGSDSNSYSAIAAGSVTQFALSILLFPTVVLGIYWDPLMNYITRFLTEISW
ncbi:MAG: NADH-quinone oxidoreductase subunit N [Bdellovibrionota bacterium]